MTCSAGAFLVPDFCLIFAPFKGYDEPEILRLSQSGPISADAGQGQSPFVSAVLIGSRPGAEADPSVWDGLQFKCGFQQWAHGYENRIEPFGINRGNFT